MACKGKCTQREVLGCVPPVLQALLQPPEQHRRGDVAKDVDHDHLHRHRKRPQPRRHAPQHDRRVGSLCKTAKTAEGTERGNSKAHSTRMPRCMRYVICASSGMSGSVHACDASASPALSLHVNDGSAGRHGCVELGGCTSPRDAPGWQTPGTGRPQTAGQRRPGWSPGRSWPG